MTVAIRPASTPPYSEEAMTAMKNSSVAEGRTSPHNSPVRAVAAATEPNGMTTRRTTGVIDDSSARRA